MGPIIAVLLEDTCGNLINLVQPAAGDNDIAQGRNGLLWAAWCYIAAMIAKSAATAGIKNSTIHLIRDHLRGRMSRTA